MHYLITGGTGFIGSALCERLLRDGHAVTVLTRNKDRSFGLLPHDVNLVQELAEIRRSNPPETVINLAGENLAAKRWNAARKELFWRSRVDFTHQLVHYLRTLAPVPRVLVSASAIGYYGARGDESLTEDAPAGSEYQSELCKAWEAQAQHMEALGVRVCRLRCGIVLGPGGALARMLPPFRLGLGGPLGHGRQWMSWIHRSDLIEMIVWLCGAADQSGAFNGTAPKPVTNREFVQALGAALKRPAVLPMPGAVLKLAFGEMAQLLLTGQKVLPARAVLGGFKFRYPKLDEALRDVVSG